MAWGRASIAGVGATKQGKLPEETPLSLAAEAFRRALADSGIDKSEVDGLLTMPGTTSPEGSKNYLNVGELLGINPRFTGSMTLGGATGGALVQIAAMAIATGMAKTVACIFADTARTGGSRFAAAAGGDDSWGTWGMFGNAANSAMGFRRHMALYGTRSEHLGWVAVTCRKHAAMNPNAVMRDPITLDDHQNSRWIVDPLRLLDCCLISDGAVCIIVTSPERARDCRSKPVSIVGMGQGHTTENLRLRDWWYLPHQQDCVAAAYRMAGVSPQDIDVAQLYDNFTVAVLFWLEHAGFCKQGEVGSFVEGGTRIQLGGELPINTAGGNLSESYMQGWLHIVEGVRQVRGECGPRQVKDAELCLVTGRGMTLNTASCLILDADMAEKPEAKPILPTINETNRPFWNGCARRTLLVQRCMQCARLRYPAGVACPQCLSPDAEWQALSGRGRVFSFIVFHRAYHPAWAAKVPYVVAMIELDEGPMMISNVVGVDPATVQVGDPVTVAYERVDDAVTIPVFKPAG